MDELTDTHCHIQSIGLSAGERTTHELWAKAPKLTSDEVLRNAAGNHITRMICVGCDLEDSELAISFASKHQQCWASIGLHPHEAKHYSEDQTLLSAFTKLAARPKVVAVGECGLDYFYEHSPKDAQKTVLLFQLALASRLSLAMIFHIREAFDDFWPLFDQYTNKLRGVVHSFTDSSENLTRALERGLYVGVNGIATFTNDPVQKAMYKAIPLDRLVLETDAPFLTPTPYRGSINEPKHIKEIVQFLSELRSESIEQLTRATTKNAVNLFGL
jgi:TatD DNase family protein